MENQNDLKEIENSMCVECGKEFEPRKGKLYCSDACKQKAYGRKKTTNEKEKTKMEEKMNIPILYKVKYSEFLEYNTKYKDEMSIELFSFLRTKITGNYTVELFSSYYSSLYDTGSIDRMYNDTTSVFYKKFQEFLSLFHGGNIEIVM
ncbi:MAG TPA: hypothetical protein DEA97_14280 [Bacteroidales bacterium]|nr:MAG: hypothetical protein UR43_C0011G0023 [candidate division TM6 bacterium GW2011_GWF2_33_332]HBS87726.1 hypothetical protein [Bacteroidales bacterium]